MKKHGIETASDWASSSKVEGFRLGVSDSGVEHFGHSMLRLLQCVVGFLCRQSHGRTGRHLQPWTLQKCRWSSMLVLLLVEVWLHVESCCFCPS